MQFSSGEVPVISDKKAAVFLGRVTGKLCILKIIALLPYLIDSIDEILSNFIMQMIRLIECLTGALKCQSRCITVL
jgi:hypothetical protein